MSKISSQPDDVPDLRQASETPAPAKTPTLQTHNHSEANNFQTEIYGKQESNYTFKNPGGQEQRFGLGSFDGISHFNSEKLAEVAVRSTRKNGGIRSSGKRGEYFILDNVSFGRNNMGGQFQGRLGRAKGEGVKGGGVSSHGKEREATMQTLKTQSVSRSSGVGGSEHSNRTGKDVASRIDSKIDEYTDSSEKMNGFRDFKRKKPDSDDKSRTSDKTSENEISEQKQNQLDKLDTMRENQGKGCYSPIDEQVLVSPDKLSVSGKKCYFEQNEQETSFAQIPRHHQTHSKSKSQNSQKSNYSDSAEGQLNGPKPRSSRVLPVQPRTSLRGPENPIVSIRSIPNRQNNVQIAPNFSPGYLNNKKFCINEIYPKTTKHQRSFKGTSYQYNNHNHNHITFTHKSNKKSSPHKGGMPHAPLVIPGQIPPRPIWSEISGQGSHPRAYKRLSYTNSKDSHRHQMDPQVMTRDSYLNSKESAKSKMSRTSKASWGSPKKIASHNSKLQNLHLQLDSQQLTSISKFSTSKTPSHSFQTSIRRKSSRDRQTIVANVSNKLEDQSPTKVSLYERPSHPSSKKSGPHTTPKHVDPKVKRFEPNFNLKGLSKLTGQNSIKFNKSSRIRKMAGDLKLDHRDFQNKFFYTERRNLKTERSSHDPNLEDQRNFSKAEIHVRGLETEPDRSYQTSPRTPISDKFDRPSPRKVHSNFHLQKNAVKKKSSKKKTSKLSLDLEAIAIKTRISKKTHSMALRLDEKPKKVLLPYNFCSNRVYGSGLKPKIKFSKDESFQNLTQIPYSSFKSTRRRFKASPTNFSQRTSKLHGKKSSDLSRGSKREIHFGRSSYGNLENSFKLGKKRKVDNENCETSGKFFMGKKVNSNRAFKKKGSIKGRFLEIRRESLNGSRREDITEVSMRKPGFHSNRVSARKLAHYLRKNDPKQKSKHLLRHTQLSNKHMALGYQQMMTPSSRRSSKPFIMNESMQNESSMQIIQNKDAIESLINSKMNVSRSRNVLTERSMSKAEFTDLAVLMGLAPMTERTDFETSILRGVASKMKKQNLQRKTNTKKKFHKECAGDVVVELKNGPKRSTNAGETKAKSKNKKKMDKIAKQSQQGLTPLKKKGKRLRNGVIEQRKSLKKTGKFGRENVKKRRLKVSLQSGKKLLSKKSMQTRGSNNKVSDRKSSQNKMKFKCSASPVKSGLKSSLRRKNGCRMGVKSRFGSKGKGKMIPKLPFYSRKQISPLKNVRMGGKMANSNNLEMSRRKNSKARGEGKIKKSLSPIHSKVPKGLRSGKFSLRGRRSKDKNLKSKSRHRIKQKSKSKLLASNPKISVKLRVPEKQYFQTQIKNIQHSQSLAHEPGSISIQKDPYTAPHNVLIYKNLKEKLTCSFKTKNQKSSNPRMKVRSSEPNKEPRLRMTKRKPNSQQRRPKLARKTPMNRTPVRRQGCRTTAGKLGKLPQSFSRTPKHKNSFMKKLVQQMQCQTEGGREMKTTRPGLSPNLNKFRQLKHAKQLSVKISKIGTTKLRSKATLRASSKTPELRKKRLKLDSKSGPKMALQRLFIRTPTAHVRANNLGLSRQKISILFSKKELQRKIRKSQKENILKTNLSQFQSVTPKNPAGISHENRTMGRASGSARGSSKAVKSKNLVSIKFKCEKKSRKVQNRKKKQFFGVGAGQKINSNSPKRKSRKLAKKKSKKKKKRVLTNSCKKMMIQEQQKSSFCEKHLFSKRSRKKIKSMTNKRMCILKKCLISRNTRMLIKKSQFKTKKIMKRTPVYRKIQNGCGRRIFYSKNLEILLCKMQSINLQTEESEFKKSFKNIIAQYVRSCQAPKQDIKTTNRPKIEDAVDVEDETQVGSPPTPLPRNNLRTGNQALITRRVPLGEQCKIDLDNSFELGMERFAKTDYDKKIESEPKLESPEWDRFVQKRISFLTKKISKFYAENGDKNRKKQCDTKIEKNSEAQRGRSTESLEETPLTDRMNLRPSPNSLEPRSRGSHPRLVELKPGKFRNQTPMYPHNPRSPKNFSNKKVKPPLRVSKSNNLVKKRHNFSSAESEEDIYGIHPRRQRRPVQRSRITRQRSENPNSKIKLDKIRKTFSKKFKNDFPYLRKMYKIVGNLGKGSYGQVYLAVHLLSGVRVAIKAILKERNSDIARNYKKITNEIDIFAEMQHKNIIQIFEVFEDNKYIFLVTEYAEKANIEGDLLTLLQQNGPLSESQIYIVVKDTLDALEYLHSKRILHRDIKLDNILLDVKNNLKLCDFGISMQTKKDFEYTDRCGTPAYIAPEIILSRYRNFSSDFWSLGVTLFILLTGVPPFKAKSFNSIKGKILKESVDFTLAKEQGGPSMIDLISSHLLEKNPKLRANHEAVRNSEWYRYYQESDVADEVSPITLESYDFSQNEHIFSIFESFTKQDILLPDFFRFLKNQEEDGSTLNGPDKSAKGFHKGQLNSEYYPEIETEDQEEMKKNKITAKFVESQFIPLGESMRSVAEACSSGSILGSNQKNSGGNQFGEGKVLSLYSDKEQKMKMIFNQMITQSRFKRKLTDVRESDFERANLTLSKSLGGCSPIWLSGADKLVLDVLERMRELGFSSEVVKKSLMERSLDCVASTFKLLSISLADRER